MPSLWNTFLGVSGKRRSLQNWWRSLGRHFPRSREDIVRRFEWRREGRAYDLKLVIRRYKVFYSWRCVHDNEWAQEYVAGGICGEARALAYKLLEAGRPYGTYKEVVFVLSFVQQVIRYEAEKEKCPKYPVEALVNGTGDCEDFLILGASILKVIGYDVALLFMPGHCTLGVPGVAGILSTWVEHDGRRYYYCEMRARGWAIGKLPGKYEVKNNRG